MASQPKVAKTSLSTQSKTVPSNSLDPKSYTCQTVKAEVDEVNFKWIVERFAFFDDGRTTFNLTSYEFEKNFHLMFNVKQDSLEIALLCSTTLEDFFRVDSTLTLCKKIYQQMKTIKTNTKFPVRLFEISKQDVVNLKSVDLGNEDITVSCRIRSLKRKVQTENVTAMDKCLDTTSISQNYQHQDLILHQLQEMFDKMPLSDVTFNIRGRKFSAHKAILAMRSPVLSAMFHHPTKEALSSKVNVDDIDPDVFQEVLRFIYTGKTQSTALNKMAPGLLAAADKYLLEDLKSWCEAHLIRQMSAENCLELLSLTTHHPAEHLKKYAIDYFRRHPGKSRLNKCLTIMIPCSFDD
jgi:speckle-type POZ protein